MSHLATCQENTRLLPARNPMKLHMSNFAVRAVLQLICCVTFTTLCSQVPHGGQPFWNNPAPLNQAPVQRMGAIDLEALQAGDAITDKVKSAAWRFGQEFDVNLGLEHGHWTQENGKSVWRMVVEAPGAIAMSVNFSQFELPKGALLFLWNRERIEFIGGFDHRNHKNWGGLATGLVAGDAVVIELQVPSPLRDACALRVDQVVHAYRDIAGKAALLSEALGIQRGPFGNSGECNINVNCPEGATWQCEKRSVALIVQGGFSVCTGALVNNTAQDGSPLFLTANHCLPGNGNVGNWTFYFNHETAGCSGNTGPTNQTISGSDLLASSGASDFGLLLLDETPPESYDVFYSGWDGSDDETVQNATGLHHPSGDLKKICLEEDAPYHDNAAGAAVWWISQWEAGVTEPGSSGSPLYDHNHRIIGQLYGGSAACNGSVNNGQIDYYGRMGVSFNNGITEHLDPLGLGLEVLDGYPAAGCVTSFSLDLGVGIANAPDGVLCGGGEVFIDVTLGNFGEDNLTSATIGYAVNGGPQQTLNWSGNLSQYDTETLTLPAIEATDGTTEVEVVVLSVNGGADENSFNNAAAVEFTAFAEDTFDFSFELVLDEYGSETTWEIRRQGNTVYSGGPYDDDNNGQVVSIPLCLEAGCYILEVEDSYGDGMCCSFGDGSFTILDPEGDVVLTGGVFGDSDVTQFCTSAMSVNSTETSRIQVNPNPATRTVQLSGLPSNAKLQAFDLLGRPLTAILPLDVNGAAMATLHTEALPRGWTLFRIDSEEGAYMIRVLLR
jgi:lysyl endopeptidase